MSDNVCDCEYCQKINDDFSDMPELELDDDFNDELLIPLQKKLEQFLYNKLSTTNLIILFIYSDPEYNKSLDFGTQIIENFNNSLDIDNYIFNKFIKNRTQIIDIYDNYINKFEPYLDENIIEGDYNINEKDKQIILLEYNNLIKWKAILEEEWIVW